MLALELPNIEYTTITQARRLSVELPYADPFRGCMYGQKNGPALALVGAASGIATGISVGGFLGGMMIVGGIASGLGALTGNETLSKIGMGLSLAGGIGSAFTTPTGEFINPFSEGNRFGETALGGGIEKMKNGVKSFFGDVTGGPVSQMGIDGNAILDTALPDVSGPAMTQSMIDAVPKTGIDLSQSGVLDKAADAAAGTAQGGGGGLLSFMGSNKDLWGMVSGAADGVLQYQDNQIRKPYYDAAAASAEANANATNLQTEQLRQRMENVKAQPEVQLGVNPNASVHGRTPGTAEGRVAVVLDGQVKYLSQAEYETMRQQQQQPSGLLNTGSPA